MQMLLINPNTSEDFTKQIQKIADGCALPTTNPVAINPNSGPKSIESIYDELLSLPSTLELVITEMDKYDAFVIACYSDHPAIYALREITDKPVMGIAEASMYIACMLGYKFSIVTTNEAWEPLLWDAVRHYGLADRCASVRSTGMGGLELKNASPEVSLRKILEISQKAIFDDQAQVICLGGAAMVGLDKELRNKLGVPVLDGVVSAVKLVEVLIGYGLSTSKVRAYKNPKHKELINMGSIYLRGYEKRDVF